LLRLLVSYSSILAMVASLGINTVTVKLFPYFRDGTNRHHGYLGLSMLVAFAGFVVVTAIFLLFRPMIIENAQEKSALFIPYFYFIIPLTFFTVLFGIFDTYYRVLYNAVKGIVYKEVIQRVLVIVAVLLYYFALVNFRGMVWLYVLAYISPALLLMISLMHTKQFYIRPEFGYVGKSLRKEMFNVGLFGVLAGFSGVLVQSIDTIMVNDYLGLSDTGIYTISFFFGALILVPMRTMGKIGSVVIAESWKSDDRATIASIYRKSSLTLSVFGLLLFVGIWGNIENVFHLVGEEFGPGRYVIFFIGLANLTDVFAGLSSHIIVNSKYFKWQTYLLVIFAALVVVTNLLLIPVLGITGAAIASFVSKFVFNGMKCVLIYKKFRIQPFVNKHLVLLFIALLSWYLSTFVPVFSNFIVDIVIRSAAITVLFMTPVYLLKVSDDINAKIDEVLRWIGVGRSKN